MMSDQEWVKAAMTDDSMVVELLVTLNQATPPPKTALPLEWTVRQPRSKTMTVKSTTRASPTTPLSWSGATSFSGGAGSGSGSGSGGAIDGGLEESSRPLPKRSVGSDTTRSKVRVCALFLLFFFSGIVSFIDIVITSPVAGDITGTSERTTSKRSRKKKTLAELKEEEVLQLKEKRRLTRELACICSTLEKQRATNESLKRMKYDVQQVEHLGELHVLIRFNCR
ncbi:unnamed protein product [Ilex paraguariensis]|uniref:Uncharacterized protein n=1 Tax=Ilex paraguariensis TaxID=185542 RepID=A0ABC8TJV6_9AQUA